MTIDDTAPIHELDRLLDAIAEDGRDHPDVEWAPTLRRLARLDDDLAPRSGVLAGIRRRVQAGGERSVAAAASGGAVLASSIGIEVVGTPAPVMARRRNERRALGTAAAAAVLLLAVGSVWLGSGAGSDRPASAPALAMAGAAPAIRSADPRVEDPARSEIGTTVGAADPSDGLRDLGPIAAADVARASVGGFGSSDLLGLVAIGAEAGQREYAASRKQALREVDASWTAFVEEGRWRALLGVPPPDASEPPWSLQEGAG